jgi:hypothetical protein
MREEVGADPVAKLGEGLHVALILGEIVIERRQLAQVDFLHVGAPFDGLAREVLLFVVRAIGSGLAIFLADLGADQRFVDSVGEALFGNFQQPVFGLGLGQRLAVLEALDGDDGEVALLYYVAALNLLEAGLALA